MDRCRSAGIAGICDGLDSLSIGMRMMDSTNDCDERNGIHLLPPVAGHLISSRVSKSSVSFGAIFFVTCRFISVRVLHQRTFYTEIQKEIPNQSWIVSLVSTQCPSRPWCSELLRKP